MSTVDVGDLVEVAFATTSGATVRVSWLDTNDVPVLDQVPVPEDPPGSGRYPHRFAPGHAGIWKAHFTASGTTTAVERFYVRAVDVTGPPPLATTGEVTELYGPMTPAEQTLTGALLRRASAMVRDQLAVDARITAGTLSPDQAAMAVINMVLRVLRNPNGLRAETVGPFSRTYDTTAAAGLLVITDAEVVLVKPHRRRTGAATIRIRPGLAPWPPAARRVRRW